MALTDEDYAELEAAIASGQLSPEVAAQAKAALGGRGRSVTPAPDNSLGVTGIINEPGEPELSPEESEMGRIAAALDPRFDLIPQSLALLPATNHPQGDEAAISSYKAGTAGEVKFAYEPPLDVVKKQLLENPGMLGLLRSDPPPMEEIAAMDQSHEIYKDAANYMWARTAEDAAEKGYTVYRYSRMPWGKENDLGGGLETLGLKLGGMLQPVRDVQQAIILGVDDMGAFGAARAADEAMGSRKMGAAGNVDVMGLDEQAEHPPEELNRRLTEEHPLAYGAGQVVGGMAGAPAAIFKGLLAGGGKVAQLAARTRLGALATQAPAAVKGAASLAGEVGAGTVEAMATQAGQEAVDVAGEAARGQAPSRERVLGAGERILDTGENAALWGLGGGALSRLGGYGANRIRNSDSLGGVVGRTEGNLEYGPLSVLLGPSLKGDAKELVRRGNRERTQPGDFIAEKIAPPIRERAEANAAAAPARRQAVQEGYYKTPEGGERTPMDYLQEQSLRKLRGHFQPEPDGKLRAIDDKGKDYQKVFNSLADSVTTTPVKGAAKLSPQEAEQFLGSRAKYQLVKDDIAEAARTRKPTDRAAYLEKVNPRTRAGVNEEIERDIEDLLQQTKAGDKALDVDKRGAEYKRAEQQVLNERVDMKVALEPFEGSLSGYLRQRGKDAVYVTPRAYDPKRVDTLIEGLTDPDLVDAAKFARKRFSVGGKAGGYERVLRQQDEASAEAERVKESIGPKAEAFRKVGRQANKPEAGDKADADDISRLADEAGVRGELDRLRNFQDAQGIQRQAWARSPRGTSRGFGVHSLADAAKIRAFPVLRALEPGGLTSGGMFSRMALTNQIEDEKAREGEREKARPSYEKRRDEVKREKAAAREKAEREQERRRNEPIKRRP